MSRILSGPSLGSRQPMNFNGPPPGFVQNQAASSLIDPNTMQPFKRQEPQNFPGDGYPLPHVWQFTAVLSGAQQTYFHNSWDEARKQSRFNALAMERDVFLQAILQERKLATSGLTWHVDVDDERDPYQKALKDGLQRILRATPYQQRHHYAALDAIWYGRHGVQHRKVWRELDLPSISFRSAVPAANGSALAAGQVPDGNARTSFSRLDSTTGGIGNSDMAGAQPGTGGFAARGSPAALTRTTQRRRCWVVDKHQPVHGDSIGHKWDGTPYILVYSAKARQLAEQGAEVFNANDPNQDPLPPGEITLTTGGSYGVVLREPYWRDRFIIHSHLSIAGEFFDVERAEAIHGAGIRDILYWFWWLKNEWLEWVITYFERVGLGISLWYFEAGNAQSYNEVFKLAEQQSRRANILVPWYANKQGGGAGGLERIETPVAGAEALLGLKRSIEDHAERYIIGQTLSSDHRGSGGLGGSGAAKFQMNTKWQIIRFDSENLADTYTQDWVQPTQQMTFPEWADIPCRFAFNNPDPEGPEKLEAVTAAFSMGVDFIKNEVRALTGLSDPQPGDDVIGGVQAAAGSPKPDTEVPPGASEDAGDGGPVFFERAGGQKTHFIREGDVLHYAAQGPTPGAEPPEPGPAPIHHGPFVPGFHQPHPLQPHGRTIEQVYGLHRARLEPAPLTEAPLKVVHHGKIHTDLSQTRHGPGVERRLNEEAAKLAQQALTAGHHASSIHHLSLRSHLLIADPQGRVSLHRGRIWPFNLPGDNAYQAEEILPGSALAFAQEHQLTQPLEHSDAPLPLERQQTARASLRQAHEAALAAGNVHTELQLHSELPPELLRGALRGDKASQLILADWLEERGHPGAEALRFAPKRNESLPGADLLHHLQRHPQDPIYGG